MIFGSYDLKKWKAKFPSVVWRCDDAFLGHAIGFATAIGKLEQMEEQILYAAHDSFFGTPAKTEIFADDTACFYFMVFKASDYVVRPTDPPVTERKPEAGCMLNGGVIFHPGWTTVDGKEVRDNSKGSWSVHT